MAKINFAEVVEQICEKDLKRAGQNAHRHVSGQELLHGLREFALKEYGPMSKAVLNEWGVKTTDDFGQVVFNLVNSGVLGKNETDSPNDFKNVFTFDDAFVKPFEPRNSTSALRKPAAAKAKKRSTSGPKKKSAGSL
jgi:uncharacterized repeat protein (TIGR04138 family)